VTTVAVFLAFFFLLRAKEYCRSGTLDMGCVLRGADVVLKSGGLPVEDDVLSHRVPDSVTINVRASKADQGAFGAARTAFKTNTRICVVFAVWCLRRWAPERFGEGPEAHLPVCRWASGDLVKREEVQALLQKAGPAVGVPAARLMSHSLRIGGASALYHATGDIGVVQRFGRWASDSVHRYLWDSEDQARGVAAAMANDTAVVG